MLNHDELRRVGTELYYHLAETQDGSVIHPDTIEVVERSGRSYLRFAKVNGEICRYEVIERAGEQLFLVDGEEYPTADA